ncbi:hypothetical protein LC593_10560 [Nostoc sp. CHAB 5844]|nr:hypothetical protein [Nostoc sp. CHAB 5844]
MVPQRQAASFKKQHKNLSHRFPSTLLFRYGSSKGNKINERYTDFIKSLYLLWQGKIQLNRLQKQVSFSQPPSFQTLFNLGARADKKSIRKAFKRACFMELGINKLSF